MMLVRVALALSLVATVALAAQPFDFLDAVAARLQRVAVEQHAAASRDSEQMRISGGRGGSGGGGFGFGGLGGGGGGGGCFPFGQPPESNPSLDKCCWYKESTCCAGPMAQAVDDLQTTLNGFRAQFHTASCWYLMEDLVCSMCSPTSGTLVDASSFNMSNLQAPANMKPRICESTCRALWNACRGEAALSSHMGTSARAIAHMSADQFCARLSAGELGQSMQVVSNGACWRNAPCNRVATSSCGRAPSNMRGHCNY